MASEHYKTATFFYCFNLRFDFTQEKMRQSEFETPMHVSCFKLGLGLVNIVLFFLCFFGANCFFNLATKEASKKVKLMFQTRIRIGQYCFVFSLFFWSKLLLQSCNQRSFKKSETQSEFETLMACFKLGLIRVWNTSDKLHFMLN